MAGPADPAFSIPGFDNYQKEVYQAADQEQAQAAPLIAQADANAKKQTDLAERFAASQEPFTAAPPIDHINEVMSGAPWLFALAALGGAAGKMSGQAMIGGLNGLSDGIIKGDQQALENGYKAYQTAYDAWKSREDQKFRIYSVLADAYGSTGEGKLKAMEAAQKMTNDAVSMKLAVDDPRTLAEIRAKLEESHAKVQEIHAKIKATDAGIADLAGMSKQDVLTVAGALKSAGVSVSGGLSGKAVIANTIPYIADHPRNEGEDIQAYAKRVAQEVQGSQTKGKVLAAESRVAGTKEAATGGAIMTLNKTGGLYDQLDKAAGEVNFGDSKIASNLRLAAQGKAVANPKIQYYVSKIMETRAELAQVFSRTGVTSDKAREMAEEALPLAASHKELQAAIRASKEAADAVESGNEDFISSLQSGKPLSESLKAIGAGAPAAGGRKPVKTGYSASTHSWFVQYDDGTIAPLGTVTPAH